MFSATQSITPLRDYSDSFRIHKTPRPRTINAKPACWSQNLVTNLSSDCFQVLTQEFYTSQGYKLENIVENKDYNSLNFADRNSENHALLVVCSKHQQSIDIAMVKEFCNHAADINAAESNFVTQGMFTSGALDFCARKEVKLISNRELLSAILKLDTSLQSTLLDQINSIS